MKAAIAAFGLAILIISGSAMACDKVEYAEAKTWSTDKLQKAYCADVKENLDRVVAKIERRMDYDSVDMQRCLDQTALYKRLLEARGKDQFKCAPAG